MDRWKYISIIDVFNKRYTDWQRDERALYVMTQTILMCALADTRICTDDYLYLIDYCTALFNKEG